ncbi:hypothetical protein EJO68_06065 [Variovorax atrisoli]|uniref:hypothetical protein n=1 Tax=Variovorax atrisoli TaxID=3394203 RepID=UPI000F7F069F|nr:hypothetical protein [Variovorax sp. 369]RTD95919.1 hypothetical protein EJO68_06065 [Variovorax sp. 369]
MLTEFLYVLAYSKRTQFILVVGVVFFSGLMIGGAYAAEHMELKSIPASLAEVIRDGVLRRYEKGAWGVLGLSLLAAVKFYRKDRKRLGL